MTAMTRALLVSALAAFLIRAPGVAVAAWSRTPYGSGVQVTPGQSLNVSRSALPDGTGGTFVLMLDVRSGSSDLYLQRITSQGDVAPGWPAGGAPVCTAPGTQEAQFMIDNGTSMVSDGAGGVYVAFADLRGGPNSVDIYAQRITGAGAVAPGWPVNGLAVSTRPNFENVPQITTDGAGGAFIAWDFLFAPGDVDIYGARVTPGGTVAWNTALYAPSQVQKDVRIASDNAGGFFVAFIDSLPSPDDEQIRVSRYNAAGGAVFSAQFACAANFKQHDMGIVADGLGGLYLAWSDYRSGFQDEIFAQHLNASGVPTVGWLTYGNLAHTATGIRQRLSLLRDNANGVLIAWDEYPPSAPSDIWMQHMTLGGSVAPSWPLNGIPVCAANNFQSASLMTPDGTGGALVSWFDQRNAATLNQDDVYALRIMGNGARAPGWPVDGAAVHISPAGASPFAIAADTLGGAIIAFGDASAPGTSITRAQRIDRFGALGNAEPDIVGVADIPNDQGGRVQITWDASYLDNAPDFAVSEYWIWRNTTLAAAQQAVAGGAQWLSTLEATQSAASPASEGAAAAFAMTPGRLFHQTETNGVQLAWEYIGRQPSSARPQYSYTAATLTDQTPSTNPYTRFLVQARCGGAGQAYWDSAPDSGLSADNVAPAAPNPFSGTYASGTSQLAWGQNVEPDVVAYRLYRGLGMGFVPGPGNLVTQTAQLTYTDPAGGPFHYKVAAVDAHGNVSPFAFTAPAGTVDAPPQAPLELALAPVAPNPAHAGVALRFDIPAEGAVVLVLHDALGRRVRTLASGTRAAGRYQLAWDGRDQMGNPAAAGIYLVTLDAGGRTLHRRFAFMK